MLLILRALREMFRKPGYIILAIAVAGLIILISIWLQNRVFLNYVFSSELFSLGSKLKILWASLGSFNTVFTTTSQILIICLALLSGVNISLLILYFKKRAKILKMAGVSGLGLIIGFLGIGCVACGSVILSSIFGLTATAGFIGLLPLRGLEFGLIGIIILCTSIYLVAKKIDQPPICEVK